MTDIDRARTLQTIYAIARGDASPWHGPRPKQRYITVSGAIVDTTPDLDADHVLSLADPRR
jgi:hypothetical protein